MVNISKRYIPRKDVLTDHLSRLNQALPSEWSQLLSVFNDICQEFGHFLVDLFATRADAKLLLCVLF